MESPIRRTRAFVLLLSLGSPAVAASDDAGQTGARPPTPAAVRRVDGYLRLDFEQLASYPIAPPHFARGPTWPNRADARKISSRPG